MGILEMPNIPRVYRKYGKVHARAENDESSLGLGVGDFTTFAENPEEAVEKICRRIPGVDYKRIAGIEKAKLKDFDQETS